MNTNAETEKGSILEVPNGASLRRLATGSTLSEALDAEANITPEDLQPPQGSDKFEDPGPPPNGGLKAWLQVLGSFMLFFNSWVSLPAIEKRDSLPKAALSLVLILPRETLAEGAAGPPALITTLTLLRALSTHSASSRRIMRRIRYGTRHRRTSHGLVQSKPSCF